MQEVFFSTVVIIDIVIMSNFSNSDFDGIFGLSL